MLVICILWTRIKTILKLPLLHVKIEYINIENSENKSLHNEYFTSTQWEEKLFNSNFVHDNYSTWDQLIKYPT